MEKTDAVFKEQVETLEETLDEIELRLCQEKQADCINFGEKGKCDYVTEGCPEICMDCKEYLEN